MRDEWHCPRCGEETSMMGHDCKGQPCRSSVTIKTFPPIPCEMNEGHKGPHRRDLYSEDGKCVEMRWY